MDLTTVLIVVFAAVAVIVTVAVIVAVVVRAQVRRLVPERTESVGAEGLARHGEAVRHQLERMTDLVHGLGERQASQHGELSSSMGETLRATAGLAETTGHLREALASPKIRGQWGERMADDVLRLAGMIEGVNYLTQRALPNGSIPDVTFLLPGDLLLHMDVKFPLDNYLKASNALSPSDQTQFETAFLRDVRQRVKELAGRGYVSPGVTVDHVLLFIPNEAVYSFVHQHDPDLADLALRQKVVLCSPFTLFAVLGVIRQSVEAHEVSRTSEEIITLLGDFEDQWKRYADQVDKVGTQLGTVQKSFEHLQTTRRNQLERQLDRIDDLRNRRAGAAVDEGDAGPPRLAPVDRAG